MRALLDRLDSDRRALLAFLSLPYLLCVVAFIIAMALTGFGLPANGTVKAKIAAFAYLYLTMVVLWFPAYSAGYAWFWWATRDDDSRLMTRLYTLPPIAALFVWFPSLTFIGVPMAERIKMYPIFALVAILLGYLWVGMVRLMFYGWRKK